MVKEYNSVLKNKLASSSTLKGNTRSLLQPRWPPTTTAIPQTGAHPQSKARVGVGYERDAAAANKKHHPSVFVKDVVLSCVAVRTS